MDTKAFQEIGRINWVTDLSEIPDKLGVSNVYAELGSVFAASCVAQPQLCAAILGTLIEGRGG